MPSGCTPSRSLCVLCGSLPSLRLQVLAASQPELLYFWRDFVVNNRNLLDEAKKASLEMIFAVRVLVHLMMTTVVCAPDDDDSGLCTQMKMVHAV